MCTDMCYSGWLDRYPCTYEPHYLDTMRVKRKRHKDAVRVQGSGELEVGNGEEM